MRNLIKIILIVSLGVLVMEAKEIVMSDAERNAHLGNAFNHGLVLECSINRRANYFSNRTADVYPNEGYLQTKDKRMKVELNKCSITDVNAIDAENFRRSVNRMIPEGMIPDDNNSK
jgi:hypothetical protein